MGLNLHDLLLAAEQAGQTVQSVRELGAAGRIQLERIQLNDTLTRAVELLQRELSAIQVELDLGELPPLTANANDWVQVWVNLLKNAQEAMENAETPRPAIWLKSHCTGAQIVFSVTDNGPGIPVSLQKKVFQPNVTTKKKGLDFGLGLGLSIVSRIVETYQGTIELDSRAGKTTFTIRLPIQ
jgi:C4-dicarboxylate-specific signal transduction histidine kinase